MCLIQVLKQVSFHTVKLFACAVFTIYGNYFLDMNKMQSMHTGNFLQYIERVLFFFHFHFVKMHKWSFCLCKIMPLFDFSSTIDKQLIQYTAFPLLALFDGNSSTTTEGTQEITSSVDKSIEVDELLESSLDPQPTQSKLVRLEPLTEAEASEATLFYLCELAPVPMDTDMPLLNN